MAGWYTLDISRRLSCLISSVYHCSVSSWMQWSPVNCFCRGTSLLNLILGAAAAIKDLTQHKWLEIDLNIEKSHVGIWEYGLKLKWLMVSISSNKRISLSWLDIQVFDGHIELRQITTTGLPGAWEAPHCYLLTWCKDPKPPELHSSDHHIHIFQYAFLRSSEKTGGFTQVKMALLGPTPFFCTASGKNEVVCVQNIAVLPGSQCHMDDVSHGFKSASYSFKHASTTLACPRTNTWAVQKDTSLGSKNCNVQWGRLKLS